MSAGYSAASLMHPPFVGAANNGLRLGAKAVDDSVSREADSIGRWPLDLVDGQYFDRALVRLEPQSELIFKRRACFL